MIRSLTALVMVLAPFAVCANEWRTDYAQAFENSKKADKPIFVYFTDSTKKADWKDQFAGLNSVTDRYELVVADKSTKEGTELFKTFEITGTDGAVIVEREQKWQYFRADRELSTDEMSKVLTDCQEAKGKPARSVLTSVSSVEDSTSIGSGFIRSSGYCPNCQRFR